MVGDAARHAQPITGGGTIQAIQGGAIVGDVIAKAVKEKNVSKKRLMEYEKRWKRGFGNVLDVGLKVKNIVLNLSDEEFTKFFRALAGEIKLREYSERAFLKEMITKNLRILFSLVKSIF